MEIKIRQPRSYRRGRPERLCWYIHSKNGHTYRKVRYTSDEEVARAVIALSEKGIELSSYKCPYCDGLHVTSS